MKNDDELDQLWNKNPDNPKLGKLVAKGISSEERDLDIAQLNYLHMISNDLETIRFRVGFLSLVVLISVVIIPFLLFASFISAFAPQ